MDGGTQRILAPFRRSVCATLGNLYANIVRAPIEPLDRLKASREVLECFSSISRSIP